MSDDDIVDIFTGKKADPPKDNIEENNADKVLKHCIGMLDDVIVLGMNNEGGIVMFTTLKDADSCIIQMELFKHSLFYEKIMNIMDKEEED